MHKQQITNCRKCNKLHNQTSYEETTFGYENK